MDCSVYSSALPFSTSAVCNCSALQHIQWVGSLAIATCIPSIHIAPIINIVMFWGSGNIIMVKVFHGGYLRFLENCLKIKVDIF